MSRNGLVDDRRGRFQLDPCCAINIGSSDRAAEHRSRGIRRRRPSRPDRRRSASERLSDQPRRAGSVGRRDRFDRRVDRAAGSCGQAPIRSGRVERPRWHIRHSRSRRRWRNCRPHGIRTGRRERCRRRIRGAMRESAQPTSRRRGSGPWSAARAALEIVPPRNAVDVAAIAVRQELQGRAGETMSSGLGGAFCARPLPSKTRLTAAALANVRQRRRDAAGLAVRSGIIAQGDT